MARDIRKAFAAQAKLSRDRFLKSLELDAAREAQVATLKQCTAPNAETVFGKEHGFASIADLDAYRSSVPIRGYDELEPWIDRAGDGEPEVLTREAPLRFLKTTGTTSKSKKIPITPTAALRVQESFLAFYGTQLAYHPEVNERPDTVLNAHLSPKSIKERLRGGFPYCSNSEAPIELRPGQEALVAPWLTHLQDVVEDDAQRLYFLLCFAALHELRAICCLHPSRFQTIAGVLAGDWQRLVKELRDGTVLDKKLRDPAPERARELEAIVERTGSLRPRDVWPGLTFVGSWSGTYLERYAPVMRDAFCDGYLAMPSMSSECFMTLTVDEDRIGHPLNVRGGVYEFVPSGEVPRSDTRTLTFAELEDGQTYEMIVTTLGGLYRYAIADLFRVVGFVAGVPRLEYVGRRAVSDLTGEKLAEEQVSEVVGAVLRTYVTGTALFTLCGVQDDGSRPRYVLVLESDAAWPESKSVELASTLDEAFKKANSRYELKRNFDDLGALRVEIVGSGTFAAYRSRLIQRGMPAGQLKDKILHPSGAAVLADLRDVSLPLRG